MKALFQRVGNNLVPDNPHALETLKKIKDGDYVDVDIRRNRNPYHHRKLFALLGLIYENQTHYGTIDELLTAFKFWIRHVDVVEIQEGGHLVRHEYPKSIAWDKMDQTEFEQFYNSLVEFVTTSVIPGLDDEQLETEIWDLIRPNTKS